MLELIMSHLVHNKGFKDDILKKKEKEKKKKKKEKKKQGYKLWLWYQG
jgi:hypothetical protein